MNGYQSIATINQPEFINLQPSDINPGMAKCDIKVLYLGKNRNRTSIDKDAATSMAKTLRGAPIVGYYKEDKQDFLDHGEQVIVDGDGVHFKNLTRPYGFVAPNAQVWFQDFSETDGSGQEVIRTYLMTTGYLWAEQYEEARQILEDGGKPQSMELAKKSLSGFWSKDNNSNYEFFIINDAIFQKLCILGDDVEPCFEGANITVPDVSRKFTLDKEFKTTLYNMMKELQYTLEGGTEKVEDVKDTVVNSSTSNAPEVAVEEAATTFSNENANSAVEEVVNETEEVASEFTSEEAGEISENEDNGSSEYAKTDDEKKEEKSEDKAAEKEDGEDKKETDEDDKKDAEKKFALMQEKFDELQASFQKLSEENQKVIEELAHYKKIVEDEEDKRKDDLIAEFSMLSDEEKQDVITHKTEYSYDTIKSKLAVMCYDKKVNYSVSEPDSTVTVDIHTSDSAMPSWLKAVEDRRKNEQ